MIALCHHRRLATWKQFFRFFFLLYLLIFMLRGKMNSFCCQSDENSLTKMCVTLLICYLSLLDFFLTLKIVYANRDGKQYLLNQIISFAPVKAQVMLNKYPHFIFQFISCFLCFFSLFFASVFNFESCSQIWSCCFLSLNCCTVFFLNLFWCYCRESAAFVHYLFWIMESETLNNGKRIITIHNRTKHSLRKSVFSFTFSFSSLKLLFLFFFKFLLHSAWWSHKSCKYLSLSLTLDCSASRASSLFYTVNLFASTFVFLSYCRLFNDCVLFNAIFIIRFHWILTWNIH